MEQARTQSHIQVRIDATTKKRAKKTLEEMGLDMSSAVKLFLQAVIITQSIPFEIRTKNGFTPTQEENVLKIVTDAVKSGKRYGSYKEMSSYISKK